MRKALRLLLAVLLAGTATLVPTGGVAVAGADSARAPSQTAGAAQLARARAVLDRARTAAPSGRTPSIDLVVDTSGSMGAEDSDGRLKLEGAKTALLNFVDGLPPSSAVGLRTYPDVSGGSCNTGTQRVAVGPLDPAAISADVRSLTADGDTPTAEALQEASAHDLQQGPGVLILISDGEATCEDPCDTARTLAAKGVDLEVISVGFAISDDGKKQLQCIADATHGAYLDARDNAALESTLGDLTGPELDVDLDYPSRAVADVGVGSDGLVRIGATVTNRGQVDAPDVVAWLRFTSNSSGRGASPGVGGPTHALGNVAAAGSVSTAWRFRPGLDLAGSTLGFEVIVSSAGTQDDVVERGSVAIVDATTRRDAGPVLKDARRIAILGDSFSAGEGSGDYLSGTDDDRNACHRSRNTYLVKTFAIPDSLVLACSGAVTADITSANAGNHVQPQDAQLRDAQKKQGRVDAVVMTLGGNDVGFADLAIACIKGQTRYPALGLPCSQEVNGEKAQTWKDEQFGRTGAGRGEPDGLVTKLVSAWAAVDDVLNGSGDLKARKRDAPIIVPAYPRIVPGSDRSCGLTGLFFDQSELEFVDGFVTDLNADVEAATRIARKRGVPAYFVPTTEDAFLPDHTICDDPAYANGLQHAVDLLVLTAVAVRQARGGNIVAAVESILKAKRKKDELLHPNPLGYEAMTRGILRWSLSAEGRRAADSHVSHAAGAARPDPSSVLGASTGGSATTLRAGGSAEVPAGERVGVAGTGFAPGSSVSIAVASRRSVVGYAVAGPDGAVRATVTLPGSASLPPGTHHVLVVGVADDLSSRRVSIAFTVDDPGSPVARVAWSSTPLVLALLALGLVVLPRRRKRSR